MNFLYPGFLFAMLAIAIPIVIHLFNFRRFKKVYFSNVQFLKEVQEQNSSREKLKTFAGIAVAEFWPSFFWYWLLPGRLSLHQINITQAYGKSGKRLH